MEQREKNESHNNELNLKILFIECHKKLYNFIAKKIHSKVDIEDILQTTFLEALKSEKKFQGASKPETWLFGIASNLIRNHYKRTYNTPNIENFDDYEHEYTSTSLDPNKIEEKRNYLRKTLTKINELPETSKAILEFIVESEESYKSAAEYLGIPIGTIKSRLSRARQSLRNSLEGKQIHNAQLKI